MGDNLSALTTLFTEFYYWVTVVIMFLIHVGFCMYEVGVSRRRNHLHTLMKNTMVIPVVTITFFLFGWWIYWALPNGPWIFEGMGGVPAVLLDGRFDRLGKPYRACQVRSLLDHCGDDRVSDLDH
jgi:hypothetical protein